VARRNPEPVMHRSTAARRAARLFGSVLGGSLLVLVGGMLMAGISYHTDAPATVLETCLAMMQQLDQGQPHDITSSSPHRRVRRYPGLSQVSR
jgi:hypothetical protein